MAHLRREREAEGLQKTLIEADAPFELMQRLFGLSSREYTRLRNGIHLRKNPIHLRKQSRF
jgi:hypothetical protein